MSVKQWSALALAATAFVVASFITTAQGQVLPKNRAPAKAGNPPAAAVPAAPAATAPVAPQPVAPAAGEAAGQTRREGRQEARDTRADARAAGETGPQARETARETRQETRQNIRGADYGLTFNNAATNGLVVSNIAANSAFATAGLRANDQLVSVNGQPITTQQQFYQYLSGPTIGTQPVQFVILRNGQRVPIVIQPQVFAQVATNNDPLQQYGLVLDDRNPNQVVVLEVYPNTPAYIAGIRKGDIITGLGGRTINGIAAFTQGLTQANGNIQLAVTRAGQTQNLQMQAVSADSAVRTALRPNFDGAAGANAGPGVGINAGANAGAQGGANIRPQQGGANIDAQGGARTPATPATPAAPASPATPAAPGTPTTPATPANPATPATPDAGTPATPSTPAPAAPAAPGGTSGGTGTP